MSLKTLLAMGDAFSATEAAAYELKQEKLPVFGAEGVNSGSVAQPAKDLPPARERVHLKPERRRIETEPEERRRFWGGRGRGPDRADERRLTQAEMRLEQVQVVRNDLSDSDLELAPRRAARAAEGDLNPFAPRPIAAIGRPSHEKQSFGTRVARWLRFLKRAKS